MGGRLNKPIVCPKTITPVNTVVFKKPENKTSEQKKRKGFLGAGGRQEKGQGASPKKLRCRKIDHLPPSENTERQKKRKAGKRHY